MINYDIYKVLIVILISIIVSSCAIPYDYTSSDHKIVGTRVDKSTGKVTKIERRKKEIFAYGILHPDGFFTKAVLSSKYEYYLIANDLSETKLPHIKKTGISYPYLLDILPLTNSNLWVAFWLDKESITKAYVGLNIIVFNEKKLLHKNNIEESIRTYTSGWDYTNNYSINPIEGNHFIIFNTKTGQQIYNVKENLLN